jgi:hypothetical protein
VNSNYIIEKWEVYCMEVFGLLNAKGRDLGDSIGVMRGMQ